MKKFFAAMILAGLVAVPVTFAAEDAPKTETPKKEKKVKKTAPKKETKTTEEKK